MGEMMQLTVDGVPMQCYTALPSGTGRHAGIVFLHHQDGLDSFTQTYCNNLAAEGYAVIAPDNFHHSPPEMERDKKKEELDDTHMSNDIAACVAWLKSHPRVLGDRLAITGHCMGGRTTYLGAGLHHVWRAAVSWYGGGSLQVRGRPGPTPYDRMSGIKCPVLGFFGKLDKNPSPEHMAKFDAKMSEGGVPHEFHAYDGADHGFCNNHGARYNAAAAQDSWQKMLAFLAKHLAAKESAVA